MRKNRHGRGWAPSRRGRALAQAVKPHVLFLVFCVLSMALLTGQWILGIGSLDEHQQAHRKFFPKWNAGGSMRGQPTSIRRRSPYIFENIDATAFMTENRTMCYETRNSTIATGILSRRSPEHFAQFQHAIDQADPVERCQRYGWHHNPSSSPRRIFFGSLIADEPWELLEIVAAETKGIFENIVFVESNRTQSFARRTPRRTDAKSEQILQQLFFFNDESKRRVKVATYVHDDEQHPVQTDPLIRENNQRQVILEEWKELGMTRDDIGIIADMDETLTRDFLRAIQTCSGMGVLDYESHRCRNDKARLMGNARIFEVSPECIAQNKIWTHPDVVLGACLEGIATVVGPNTPQDATIGHNHPFCARSNIYTRQKGHGGFQTRTTANDLPELYCDFSNITDRMYPLFNAADFRMSCGGSISKLLVSVAEDGISDNGRRLYAPYTAYHFHNFFANFKALRFKYQTFGHPTWKALSSPLYEIHKDLAMVYSCLLNKTEEEETRQQDGIQHQLPLSWKRLPGGFQSLEPYFVPIYFMDPEYRMARHHAMVEELLQDDRHIAIMNAGRPA